MSLEGRRYVSRACESCGDLNRHGQACDNPSCSNYDGPLVRVVLKVVYVQAATEVEASSHA